MGLFFKDIVTFDHLFLQQLQDVYYAENQITKALPKGRQGNGASPETRFRNTSA